MNHWWRKPVINPGAYVLRKDYGGLGALEHLNDTAWDEAPIPSWLHRCWAQTRMTGRGETDLFCPCGGQKSEGRWNWVFRNTRSPRTPQEQAGFEHSRHMDALFTAYYTAEQARDYPRMKEIRSRIGILAGDS